MELYHLTNAVSETLQQTILLGWNLGIQAFVRNQYSVSVFFDLERAHDTCRYGIWRNVIECGVYGNLLALCKNLVSTRTFRVRRAACPIGEVMGHRTGNGEGRHCKKAPASKLRLHL